MYTGSRNPNLHMQLEKMKIRNTEHDRSFKGPATIEVLYNPQSYVQSRSVEYSQNSSLGSDAPLLQYMRGGGGTLSFELFFDSLSAGDEVGGGTAARTGFARNAKRSSKDNKIDVRTYTDYIFELMRPSESKHRPPRLEIKWASLQFRGFLTSCEQNFTKFSESGVPVRATLKCQFIEDVDQNKARGTRPFGSPDTTKFRTVRQGDSLWAFALQEYGDAGRWRDIARANGIANPRALRPGDVIVLPAVTERE